MDEKRIQAAVERGVKKALADYEPAEPDTKTVEFNMGWKVDVVQDDDGHLNIYIQNEDNTDIAETDTDIRCDGGDEIHLRFTTEGIEEEYNEAMGEGNEEE